jgi:hypothetical protein
MNSLYNTLTDIYACLRLVIALACIVLAIIIICKKEKATKMLGISILMISSAVLVSFVLSLSYRGMREYFIAKSFSIFATLLTSFLNSAALLFIFLYATMRYRIKKFVIFFLIANRMCLGFIISFLWQFPYRAFITTFNAFQYRYATSMLNMVPSIIETVILFAVFLANRPKERDLKLLFLKYLADLIIYVMILSAYIFAFIVLANYKEPLEGDRILDIGLLIINYIRLIIMPAFTVYILVKGRRKQPEKLIIV